MKDFKAFLVRGNVVDLAVGIVIGAAFGVLVDGVRHRVHLAADRAARRRQRTRDEILHLGGARSPTGCSSMR